MTLSVLKKDGSWDLIYRQPYYNTPQIITIEDCPLSFDEADYARGTTGGLRYRLCIGEAKYDPIYKKEYYLYRIKYFTRDYTPQKAHINYSGRLADTPIYSNSSTSLIDDEYFVDVKIGIANIEGTTKVVVEQLDEGESLPFLYEVKDFRKGYFIANLDRELTTQLTVVCYNENGYKRSNTITIPPMGYSSRQLLFDRISDDIIHISGLQKIDGISYSVQNLVRTDLKLNNKTLVSEDIDISNISNGVYILNVYEYGRTIGTYKFCK